MISPDERGVSHSGAGEDGQQAKSIGRAPRYSVQLLSACAFVRHEFGLGAPLIGSSRSQRSITVAGRGPRPFSNLRSSSIKTGIGA